ncbi:hypothetical protein A2164_04160 [Candidatus Curtissbacteria bacterium RBG_13_35_7]|uniref:Membrane protein 6-pyruvoyl-tetrahydropterin synthase-related domain-containing protein n=1 Tax=Candidatus Curtissbacteria bacterium RBG_13_35_7 TaxID=1797705 RepID=A0A1F5G135_9BACT|nr:MAG: hypothetical protein A2164_04160 [Candidatus Curtissbacteria bacterium RBG_13_35_7]
MESSYTGKLIYRKLLSTLFVKDKHGILLSLLIIIVVSLIGIRELFLPGFFDTHDGFTHIMRLAHFDMALNNGQFPVRWLPTWMAGYGSPVFNFNYSFPYYIGSLFHSLGLPYETAIEAVLAVGYLFSGIFLYLFLKELLQDNLTATVGAILYVWAPYRFTDIFIRGALGEATSFLFFPLLFWLMIKAYKSQQKSHLQWTGIIWGLCILNHNIMSLIGSGLFFTYILYIQLTEKINYRFLKDAILAFIIGLGLSAFFWIPSILESKYTNILNAYHFDNGYPSLMSILYSKWQYGFATPSSQGGSMSFQLGLVHLAVPIFFLLVFLKAKHGNKHDLIAHGLFFLTVFLISVFLIIGPSSIIYNHLSFLKFVIFPWRFLEIATLSTSILAAIFVFLMAKFKVVASLSLIILAVLLYWPYSTIITSRFSLTDDVYSSMTNTNTGLLPETEFAPVGESYFQLLQLVKDRGPASFNPFFEDDTTRSKIENIQNKNLLHTANIVTSQPVEIRANTFYFPGWRLYIDDQESAINKDKYGLIKFTIQPSNHNIRLVFKNTLIRTVANTISIVTFLLFLLLLFKVKIKNIIKIYD